MFIFLCRRQVLKVQVQVQRGTKLINGTEKSIDFVESVNVLSDKMDSNISTKIMQCQERAVPGTYVEILACNKDNETFVIDNTGVLDTNRIQENLPEGRRIVDISFVWKEIHRTFNNHARGIECQFKDWKLVKHFRRGLLTQLFFKCQMCHYEANIWSEPTESTDVLDINTAAVAGTVTIGIGHFQLQELCAAMNIPSMSENTYTKYRDEIVGDFEKTAMESMKIAGESEKQLALERNETINGIPYITVVADGSWMKRSYGTAYDSPSGAGAIIGFRTGKILFTATRNKFCAVCVFAERRGIEPRPHKCFRNFDPNASSTSMECDIIVEGFKVSIPMHGLIYKTVVADGDSNVYQSIINNRPYHEQMVKVKKVECTNHLLRNLCKKLKVVAETTQPKTLRMRGFVQLRNIVKNNILNIRKEVIEAAALRKEEKLPHHYKATELQTDILNIPSHVFGEHRRCKERGRLCLENRDKKNYVPYLKLHGLYQKIENAVAYLSTHADSLLLNVTNNPAESFNSIICKEIGGKRIHFGKKGSYNARIAGAVVQYNTQQVLTQMHESMCKNVPSIIEKLEKRRQIKVARTKESREVSGRKKTFKRELGTDRHYGPQSQKPDLTPDVYEHLRLHHLQRLYENGKNSKQIERDTIHQRDSELWHVLRNQMLTASNFGTVCRMRPTTSCTSVVKSILFPPAIDTAAMKYGRDNEEIARKELAVEINTKIEACGFFIDCENPCLGASPDGLIDEDGVVEIKCPSSAEHLTAEEAVRTLPQLKSIFDKRNPEKMNRNHRFFYQVQGQLNITQRDYCIFAVWTPKSLKVIRVTRDHAFWRNQMLPLLTRFYNECMLPEILDSRHNRHMPIRDPRYITEAKEEACKKRNAVNIHTQKHMKEESVTEDSKRLKRDVLSSTTTAVATADTEQDDDCIVISYSNKKQDLTDDDVARHKTFLDNMIPSLSSVKKNVLPVNSKLNDESLDLFLRIIRETSSFETQSVLYLEYPHMIEVSRSDKSLQIIGGNCSDHWRCIFFDGTKLRMYDSLPNCTYDKLNAKEKEYIRLRYPNISKFDIIFEKVQIQSDCTCCGIYAAAFATTVALGSNPCNVQYSKDVKCMREHFMKIVESNELRPFPIQ